MKTKTTQLTTLLDFRVLNVLILFLFGTATMIAQTVTSVYPTRVTAGVTVTIEGTGFTNTTRNSIKFRDGGMNVEKKQLIGTTTMTFEIGRNNTTLNTNPTSDDPINDISRELQIVDSGGADVNTTFWIDYIAPKAMIQAENDFEGRRQIPIANRVEEIYTDFVKGGKNFQDGDAFNRNDYIANGFGQWEFFGLEFPANPEGILVEAGGGGRGMFIGFNKDGDFVARGGDGSSFLGNNKCARLVITPATYNFSGKSGRLLVTMDAVSGVLTLGFDEGNTGFFDYQDTKTAIAPPFQNNEWSGGNDGAVGNWAGNNIAGPELNGNYNFNGTIGNMAFSNVEGSSVAWRSSQGTYTNQPNGQKPANPIIPDNYHDLLGFKINGKVYSTGANNALLELFLGSEIVDTDGDPINGKYVRQRFKAYSSNGVQNTTVSQHHIFTGEFVDGVEREGALDFLNPTEISDNPLFDNINGLSMFEVLIDGKNGLNIGSGINNLNQSTSIQFYSGEGVFGGVSDGYPDLLVPNMAEAGGTDVYYYTDALGNVIGRPISIRINNDDTNNPPLSHWQNDQYRVTLGVGFDQAKPSQRIYGVEQERPMRLIAFSLDDFGISELSTADYFWQLTNIENINAGAGGTADIPFLAYNADTFAIKSPEVTTLPTPRSVCEVPSTIDVIFNIVAGLDGGPSGDPLKVEDEKLYYKWYQFNTELVGGNKKEYTVEQVDESDLGLYRVLIWNAYGATIVTVPISEGGTPAIWSELEDKWTYPRGFKAESDMSDTAGQLIPVADQDRRLIFSDSYDVDGMADLVGCDCLIPAGKEVTVSNERTLKLYGEVIMSPEEPILDPDDGTPTGLFTPAGKLIIEDGSSLLQTKDTDVNDNVGEMAMTRIAKDPNALDYVYWSSPVDESFNIDDLSIINTSRKYQWKVKSPNTNGTQGNWISADGSAMETGRGYIVRMPTNANFPAVFNGVPNNGDILVPVLRTDNLPTATNTTDNRDWNLVGNPYPSAINVEKFLKINAKDDDKIEGAVHIWESNKNPFPTTTNPADSPFYQNFGYNYLDSYITITGLAPLDPNFNGSIGSGQGFFVKVADVQTADTEILFSNFMRYEDDSSKSPLDNTEFYRNSSGTEQEKQLLWLTLVNEERLSVRAVVGYAEGATKGKDRFFDASLNSVNDLELYSVIDDSKLVIQGRPLPFDEQDLVRLGVQIPANGLYKIAIDHLKGSIFENESTNIIIEDTRLGILHNLREEPYAFTGEAGTFNERFVLRYTANLLSSPDVELPETFAFIKDAQLHVRSANNIETMKVYDISGKEVMDYSSEEFTNRITREFQFSRGVYIAVIMLEYNIKVTRKLIN